MEELVAGHVGQKDVRSTIVVVVPDGYAHSVARPGESGALGYIGERAVVIVAIETVPVSRRFLLQGGNCCSVDQINIQPAVAVIVEQRNSCDHRFDLILVGCRRITSDEVDTRFCSNVFESDGRWIGCGGQSQGGQSESNNDDEITHEYE